MAECVKDEHDRTILTRTVHPAFGPVLVYYHFIVPAPYDVRIRRLLIRSNFYSYYSTTFVTYYHHATFGRREQ